MNHPILYKLSVFRHHIMGKPYFYGASTTTPHRTPYMRAMAERECSRLGRRLQILEVGTFRGKSLAMWADYGHVMCVDIWPEGMGVFLGNMRVMGLWSPRDYLAYQGDSRTVLPELVRDGFAFDVVYIDGDHSYEGCKSDLEWGRDLVRPGGILCGDDLEDSYPGVAHYPGVNRAVKEILGDVENQEGFFEVRL